MKRLGRSVLPRRAGVGVSSLCTCWPAVGFTLTRVAQAWKRLFEWEGADLYFRTFSEDFYLQSFKYNLDSSFTRVTLIRALSLYLFKNVLEFTFNSHSGCHS